MKLPMIPRGALRHPRFPGARLHSQRGFALIVTLTLMILLTVIAVGLLTLSSISLRSSSQSNAMSIARSNAKMGLMLALGDLQKHSGPDQRITARADILGQTIANPRLTGIWRSWEIKADSPPAASDYEKTARDDKFLGWLASSTDGTAQSEVEFAASNTTAPVTLWDKGSLGELATAQDLVSASKVTLSPQRGAYAWAVMDEGIKARINTPFVGDADTKGGQTAQLGSGVRPNVSSIKTLENLDQSLFAYGSNSFAMLDKGITRLNFAHAADQLALGSEDFLKPLTHDVTSLSVGLFTDVAAGGLKEDFNLLTNASGLPAVYDKKGVYDSRLGTTGPSDPRWESLQQLAQLYKQTARLTTF